MMDNDSGATPATEPLSDRVRVTICSLFVARRVLMLFWIQRDTNLIRRRNYGTADTQACTAIPSAQDTSDSEPESQDGEEDDESTTESRPCICMGCLGRVLGTRHLAGDLAGHMFGHLVSTDLARDILTEFISDGVVQVFESPLPGEPVSRIPIDPHPEKVQDAVRWASEAIVAHDCIRLPPEGNAPEECSPLISRESAEKEKTYLFEWSTFPKEPLRGHELVLFFNEITDRAFAFAKSLCPPTKLEFQHRFAAPEQHAVSLTFGLCEEVVPPDFFLLPIEAFSGAGFKTVDERYFNFTTLGLVGGLNNVDPMVGLEQMKQYAENLKRIQPWIFYVLGMTISPDVIVFSRGDCSGWEHLALVLWDGRGCIELIRILLGVALSNSVVLGQNPFITLKPEIRTCRLNASSEDSDSDVNADAADDAASATSCHSNPTIPYQKSVDKRHHSQIEKEDDDDDDDEDDQRMKKRMIVDANSADLSTVVL